MRLITTEAQRHREIEEGKDPRTSPIIGAAAVEVHRNLVRDSLSRRGEYRVVRSNEAKAMRLITTEAQRHREIEDGKDPRTSLSSVPPSRCIATWVRDSLSRHMRSVCATNSISAA